MFEIRTVSNGSSFFPVDLWPKRKAEKKRGSVTYSTARENEVSKAGGKEATFKFSGRTVKYGPLN